MGDEFIGAGWAFPLRTSPNGSIALVTKQQEIEESIRLILGTAFMERPMRPEFGCGIHDYVFASLDSTVKGRISHEVRIAIERWEPRVNVVDIETTVSDNPPDVVSIRVTYVINGSNDPRNLVFPFYVIPQEEEKRTAALERAS